MWFSEFCCSGKLVRMDVDPGILQWRDWFRAISRIHQMLLRRAETESVPRCSIVRVSMSSNSNRSLLRLMQRGA